MKELGLGLSWVRVGYVLRHSETLTEVRGVPPMPTYPLRRPMGVVGARP